jgi:hypothetical protein
VPPSAVERARGRVDGAVAEQALARVQRHPGVSERGGQTRPAGREAVAGAAPRGALRAVGALWGGSAGQGRGAVLARHEPRRGAVEGPGGAPCGQQTGR